MIGVVASLVTTLAEEGVSVFIVSTFDTDCLRCVRRATRSQRFDQFPSPRLDSALLETGLASCPWVGNLPVYASLGNDQRTPWTASSSRTIAAWNADASRGCRAKRRSSVDSSVSTQNSA